MSDYVIEIKNATKQFREEVALDGINLHIEREKIIGIVGRNGSGKTVLLKCIVGLMPLTKGEIYVDGKRVTVSGKASSDIGMIIETPGFLPNYNAFKNLWLLAAINKKITKAKVKSCLILVGLDPNSKKRVGKFSLGMRQRLGIAQAIMEHPAILLLDEPMNGLDNAGVEDMRALFLKLKDEGVTIILASHNKEDIEFLCDHVYSMDKGRITKER